MSRQSLEDFAQLPAKYKTVLLSGERGHQLGTWPNKGGLIHIWKRELDKQNWLAIEILRLMSVLASDELPVRLFYYGLPEIDGKCALAIDVVSSWS
jgi:hypothetical protein